MALVKYDNRGYIYCDLDGTILFEGDYNHEFLFNYISKDLSQLPILLERYVSKKMNIATFELADYASGYEDKIEIYEFLEDIHPYFEHECREVFIREVGEYFNSLLIQSSYNKENNSFLEVYDKEWYLERIYAITDDFIDNRRKFEYFYKRYINIVNKKTPLLQLQAEGFYNELQKQEDIKRMLFWLIDISAPDINSLTISQRVWLYENIFNKVRSQPEMEVVKKLSFGNPHEYGVGSGYLRMESKDENDYLITLTGDLRNYHLNQQNIHPNAREELLCAIDYAKEVVDKEIYDEYEIADLYQLLFLEITKMIESKTSIKRCKNCGMYFVVTNQNMEYCSRIADGETKPCSMIGSKRTFEKKLKEDIPLKIYNRAYKTHFARVRNGIMTRNEFNSWCITAKENLKNTRDRKMEITDFENWLKL